jgi:hypothetical protein
MWLAVYESRKRRPRVIYNLAVSESNFDIVVIWMPFRIALAKDFGIQPSKVSSTWFIDVSCNPQKL